VWIHGMLFAYLHPSFEAALQRIDKMSTKARLFVRTVITAGQSSWHVAHAGNSPDADKDLDLCFVGWMQYGTCLDPQSHALHSICLH